MPAKRIFTATLVIGISGAGKTSLSATFSEYLWDTYKQILLLYSCDGGAFPTVVQKRVKQGLIRVWRMRTRSAQGLAFETCYLGSKGYWPKVINPTTGESAPAVELVPGVTTTYRLFDPEGHLLKTVPSASLIRPTYCSTCKAMIDTAAMTVTEIATQTPGFEQVGGVYFDGLTSMSSWFMGDLDERAGRGELGGEKSAIGGTIKSGDLKFGGNSRAHFGFAQTRIQQIVHNSLSIPSLSEGPVFTALTHEVEEGGQLPVVGPRLAGSAKTDEAPQWFGNVFEARAGQDSKGKHVRRLYLKEFIDGENRRHLLKNSSSGRLPDLLEDPAYGEGPMFSQFNLGLVFRLLDQDLETELSETIKDAPGLPDGLATYGSPAVVEEPKALTPQAPEAPKVAVPRRGPAVPVAAAPPAAPVRSAAPPPPGRAPLKVPGLSKPSTPQ